jgi:ATP-dependent DNA helicase PIF1
MGHPLGQLPPVTQRDKPRAKLAFQAECWESLIGQNTTALTQVFRQKEKTFIELLNNLRKGECTLLQEKLLRRCDRPVQYPDGVEPVSL